MENIELYQKYKNGRHWDDHPTDYAERFASFLKVQNFDGLLVDIGCGKGRDVDIFQRNEFNVLGIDVSSQEINIAQRTYPFSRFQVDSAERLSFPENCVGAFYMVNVIHYTDREKAVSEMYRTLKDKGFSFMHFNLSVVDKDGNVDYQQDEEEVKKLILPFDIVESQRIQRIDSKPIEHTHDILELILQK